MVLSCYILYVSCNVLIVIANAFLFSTEMCYYSRISNLLYQSAG